MKALKTISAITLSIFFFLACSTTEPAKDNTNQSIVPQPTNTNSSPTASDATPPAQANANNTAGTVTPPSPSNANRQEQPKAASDSRPANTIDAVAIYGAQRCDTCHGADGKGKIKGAPDMSDPAWQKKNRDADIIKKIKDGKMPLMPPYASVLSDAEIKALTAYIRSFGK